MKQLKLLLKNIYLYIALLLISSCIFIFGTIIHINILSLKFTIPISLALLIVTLIHGLILLKNKTNKKIKIFFSFTAILFSIAFFIGSYIILNTVNSVKTIFATESFIDYSLITQIDNSYKKVEDINNKIIGFYVDDTYHDSAKEYLDKKVNIEYIGYSSIDELETALLNKDIDAVLILDSYLDSFSDKDDEQESVENESINKISLFRDNTKVIYTFKIKTDNSNHVKNIDIEKGSFAIFVSGQDSFATTVSDASRSDVNMLMVVNINTKQILLLSIPRDYFITIKGKNAYDKLTHISIYGTKTAADSLGELLDVEVDYFVKFNFTTFIRAIEYMLPLDVYSDYDFTTGVYDRKIGNSYTFKKGYNHITSGEMALQFVRARKNFAEGDRQRGINQTRMVRAVINKVTTPQVLLKYNDILNSLDGTFLTNISDDSIMEIIRYIINNNGKFDINSYSLSGGDASRTCYSSGSQPLYVMIPNTTSIDEAKIYINNILNGEKTNIETDASELADSSNSYNVTMKPYVEKYYYTNKNNNENKNDNKEESFKEKENPEEEKKEEETNNEDNSDENKSKDDSNINDDNHINQEESKDNDLNDNENIQDENNNSENDQDNKNDNIENQDNNDSSTLTPE